ncbi:MAG: insulinase family protein, partial [Eubacteriales bacterium]|nr:insulinase family protein [Eubacteriales bacterium]
MIDKVIYKNIEGIKLCFVQKKGYVEKQAMIAFNYGSAENIFIKDNKEIHLPPGIAHFLEHKMFEDEEYNVFEVFNKYGGNVNAFTNFSTTAYYFTCVENFNENFKELLKFVSRPYFTEENVEKEKGIIEQEIKMYDDDPYWKVYFNLIGIMYDKDNPITKDIAGEVSDIKKIDKDMLYTCYNNFYTKDNAIVIVCGDIDDLESVEENILQNLKLNEKKLGIVKEFNKIQKNKGNYVEKKMEIKQKIFNIGFKDVGKYDKIEKQIISNKILLDIIFGTSSKFYEKMYN